MGRETEISITQLHFPASKFVIARPAPPRSVYINEFYNADRNDWGQKGTLWSYRSHAETVLKALHKAINTSGAPSLDRNVCPCAGCKRKQ